MEVLIGVDPRRATNVLAALDEQGESSPPTRRTLAPPRLPRRSAPTPWQPPPSYRTRRTGRIPTHPPP
jgi:hypothetical protein